MPLTVQERAWLKAHPRVLLGTTDQFPPETRLESVMVIRNDWPTFVEILDRAIEAIPQETHLRIQRRWMGPLPSAARAEAGNPLGLTPDEVGWLQSHRTLRYCFEPAWAPYDFLRQGEHRGLFRDYLGLVLPLEQALYWMDERAHNGKIIGKLDQAVPVSLAVGADSPQLRGILNKAIASVTQTEHADLQRRWQTRTIEQQVDYRLLRQVLLAAAVVLVGMLVWVRTLRGLNRQLEAARRAAEDATRAKSRFLADMSHEIRNPMNAIIGLSHLAQGADPGPRQQQYLRKIQGAAEVLLGVIDDVLDVSKIEAGKLRLEQTGFRLPAIFNRLADILEPLARHKGLELCFVLDPRLEQALLGDPLRLTQVLLNLGTNAVKFTEQGRVQLGAASVADDAAGVRIGFEVRDTGIGMDAQTRERVFLPFEQGDASIQRHCGGTGLGLALARQFVQAMGGALHVETAPGRGSTFRFELGFPVAADLAEDAGADRCLSDLVRVRGARVLLVEDDPINRQVAREQLQRIGLSVTESTDGREALEALRLHAADAFDLVLMDIKMPGMDGLEATRRLRAEGLRLPVIAMTSQALVGDREASLDAGMNDHLTKPIDVAALHRLLLRWLPRRTARIAGAEVVGVPMPGESVPQQRLRWPRIAGLDFEQGLRRSGGSSSAYLELLAELLARHRDCAERIRLDLASGAAARARLRTHTLRGSAGTLGAITLAELATDLEQALGAEDEARLRELLPRLERYLETFCADLGGCLDEIRSTRYPGADSPVPLLVSGPGVGKDVVASPDTGTDSGGS